MLTRLPLSTVSGGQSHRGARHGQALSRFAAPIFIGDHLIVSIQIVDKKPLVLLGPASTPFTKRQRLSSSPPPTWRSKKRLSQGAETTGNTSDQPRLERSFPVRIICVVGLNAAIALNRVT
jgi:hypothetical protein